eukprot:2722506-Prymnesium_polylepis.1
MPGRSRENTPSDPDEKAAAVLPTPPPSVANSGQPGRPRAPSSSVTERAVLRALDDATSMAAAFDKKWQLPSQPRYYAKRTRHIKACGAHVTIAYTAFSARHNAGLVWRTQGQALLQPR